MLLRLLALLLLCLSSGMCATLGHYKVQAQVDDPPTEAPVVDTTSAAATEVPEVEPVVADGVVADTPEDNALADGVVADTPEDNSLADVVADTPKDNALADGVVADTPEDNSLADVVADIPKDNALADGVVADTPEDNALADVVADTPEDNALADGVVADTPEDDALADVVADTPEDNALADGVVADTPEDNALADGVVADTPEDNALADGVVADTPEDNALANGVVADTPEDNAIADDKPVVDEPDAEAAPAVDMPVADAPAAAEESVTDSLVADEKLSEDPVANNLVAEDPVADSPAAEEPLADSLVADKPAADDPVADSPAAAEEPAVESHVAGVAEEPAPDTDAMMGDIIPAVDAPAMDDLTQEALAQEAPAEEELGNEIEAVPESQQDNSLAIPQAEEEESSWDLGIFSGGFRTITGYFDSLVELVGGRNGVCQYRCREGEPQPRPGFQAPEPNGCSSSLVGFQFDLGIPAMTMCCDQLDMCYDTCGMSKSRCDSKFRWCLHGICSDLKKSLGLESKVQACETLADTLYSTVGTLGCTPYLNGQRAACVCDGEERDEL